MKEAEFFSISWQPDGVNLKYFKLKLFDQSGFLFWNIKGLLHWEEKKEKVCGKNSDLCGSPETNIACISS